MLRVIAAGNVALVDDGASHVSAVLVNGRRVIAGADDGGRVAGGVDQSRIARSIAGIWFSAVLAAPVVVGDGHLVGHLHVVAVAEARERDADAAPVGGCARRARERRANADIAAKVDARIKRPCARDVAVCRNAAAALLLAAVRADVESRVVALGQGRELVLEVRVADVNPASRAGEGRDGECHDGKADVGKFHDDGCPVSGVWCREMSK